MPTPDGRSWLTSDAIATRIVNELINADIIAPEDRVDATAIAATAYRNTGYGLEFKILRLTEKLRMAIENGQFTDVGSIQVAFNDIYRLEVLDQFDEEGNYIGEEPQNE